MKDSTKVNAEEHGAGCVGYFKAPVMPVAHRSAIFLAQLVDSLQRLHACLLDVSNFNSILVDDLLMTVHKVEVASHNNEQRPPVCI